MKDIVKGQIVISKAGRDKGDIFIVVDYNEPYVFLADGKLRRLEAPKKKKIKHIQVTHFFDNVLHNQLQNDLRINNADIRKSLNTIINHDDSSQSSRVE